MKKKQSYAFANLLMLVAIPTVVVGVAVVSAKAEDTQTYNPKSLQFELFEPTFFRMLKRDSRQNVIDSSLHEAAPTQETGATALSLSDLTESQRSVLRMQVRQGGCPQDVDVGYRLLCESLLLKREKAQALEGWKNRTHQ